MPPQDLKHKKLQPPSEQLLAHLTKLVGKNNAITDPQLQKPYLHEWRDRYIGRTPILLRPDTTAQVSKILKAANEACVAVVPQSGNTGLVGGQIPSEDGTQILLNISRLNRFRSIAPNKQHMTVEAGATLTEVQQKAQSLDRLFPLAMASQGSCQIGGNIATNAGGLNVLAYGSTRNLVSGLEVVLADGRIWNGLKSLKKDNTGYDLRDLFIGSEGTLGIITAAVLKLYARPKDTATAFLALDDLNAIASLFEYVSLNARSNLTAFEFMPAIAMEFVTAHIQAARLPLSSRHPWYVLMEISEFASQTNAQLRLEEQVNFAMKQGDVKDGVIASSLKQSSEIWRLRETISEAQKPEGGSIKHDISVPIESIPNFINTASRIVEQICPGARPVPFGHFGDGNIHYNISQPPGMDKTDFLALWETMSEAIHELVTKMDGSISAEHGIGRMKKDSLIRHKSPVELQTMRAIKEALDPKGILNPGKVL